MAKTKRKPYTGIKPKPKKEEKNRFELTWEEIERLVEKDENDRLKAIAKAKAIKQKHDDKLKLTDKFLRVKSLFEGRILKTRVLPKLLAKLRTDLRRRKNAEYLRESEEMLENLRNRYASGYAWAKTGIPIIEENLNDMEALRLKGLYWVGKMFAESELDTRCSIEWSAKYKFAYMMSDIHRRRRDRHRIKKVKRDALWEHKHYIKERIIIHYMTSELIDEDEDIEFFKQKEYDDNRLKEDIIERIYKRYKKHRKEYNIDYVDYAIQLKLDVENQPEMTESCNTYFRTKNGLIRGKKRLHFMTRVDGYKMWIFDEEQDVLDTGCRDRYAAIARDTAHIHAAYRHLFFELEELKEDVAEAKREAHFDLIKLERLAKQENLEDKADPFYKRLGIDIIMKFEPKPKWSVYYRPDDTDFTEQTVFRTLDYGTQDDIEEANEWENFSIRMNQTQLATDRIMKVYELLMHDNQQLKLSLTNYMGGMEAASIPRNKFTDSFLERNRKITARLDRSLEAERKRKEMAKKIGLPQF